MVHATAKPQTNRQILWRCFRYLGEFRRYVVGIYLLMVIINLINVSMPQNIRWMIDQGIYGGGLSLLGWGVLGLMGITALKGLTICYQGIWGEISSQEGRLHIPQCNCPQANDAFVCLTRPHRSGANSLAHAARCGANSLFHRACRVTADSGDGAVAVNGRFFRYLFTPFWLF